MKKLSREPKLCRILLRPSFKRIHESKKNWVEALFAIKKYIIEAEINDGK
jgi:hypothetical protein